MKKFNPLFLVATASLVATTSFAAPQFGMSTTQVTTSVVEKVDKNLGKLSVSLTTQCQESAEAAEDSVKAMKFAVSNIANDEVAKLELSDAHLDEESDKVHVYPANKYNLNYPNSEATNMMFLNGCSDEQIALGGLGIEKFNELKEAKVYSATLVMTFVAQKNIAKLGELKQTLNDVMVEWNEKEVATGSKAIVIGNVNNPIFSIDEATQEALKESLTSRLGIDSQTTQTSVDEAFFTKYTGKGFAEKYINTSEYANITYSQTRPQLLDDGKVKLNKSFYFTVSFLASNLGSDKMAQPEPQMKNFGIDTEMTLNESDVESYVAYITVGTQCQTTRKGANEVYKKSFSDVKAAVDAELNKLGRPDTNSVKIDPLSEPSARFMGTAIQRKKVFKPVPTNGGNQQAFNWVATHFYDLCSGEITAAENRSEYWSATQSFRVLTDDFKTFEKVKEIAETTVGQPAQDLSYLESNQYPIVTPRNQPVVLKDENWRMAVDATMYEQALEKLTDPDGEVAKYLFSDNVQATEAYYSQGVSNNLIPVSFASGLESALDSGPQAASYDGAKIILDDSNIDSHVQTAAVSYVVTWRPEVDVVELIKMRKASSGLK